METIETLMLEEFSPEYKIKFKAVMELMQNLTIDSIVRLGEDKILRLHYVDDTIYDVNMKQGD